VLLVVAQPTVNANRAMTLIMFNEVRICFIFLVSLGFAVVHSSYKARERE